MRYSLKSVHFQVLLSFIIVILLTLTVSTAVEYSAYASELPRLFTEMRARTIAGQLSSTYTRDEGWENLQPELQRINNLESLNTSEDAALRVIVRDLNGRTLYNSFSNLTELGNAVLVEGDTLPIIDYRSGEKKGSITVYISRDYVDSHARVYIVKLLRSAVIKALITALAAIIFSLIISRRITKPITHLTAAVQAVAEGRDGSRISAGSFEELSRLGNAFNTMLDALNSQSESRKKLTADMSHEINNPLTAIKLEARGMLDGLVDAEEAAGHILKEVDALRNIVYDLDWLAETDSGAYLLNRHSVNLHELISVEVKRWEYKARTLNTVIQIAASEDPIPFISLDTVRVSTALGNLVENALKYSPAGSSIRIGCSIISGDAAVSVCDSGPSVPVEKREKIFNRFYHEDVPGGRGSGGRGLGLSIVRQVAEMHGGRAWLECGEYTGNCFYFSIPLIRVRTDS